MEKLEITPTEETPRVVLDKDSGLFEFSGKSLPEDVNSFYGPVIKWLDLYKASPNASADVTFKMSYFNTASSKMILEIFMKLEEIHQAGGNVTINWHYEEDDEDMHEAGEEYSGMVEVPFKLSAS
ncbi:MAG: nuclear pore complex subunit [Bacteroidetes bacterium RIFCSPLOWO2_12_FULL_31_6]|nr:MAG: nuclear pore complex subunit [Bacteroidetes bacterium RIFCSPLOWO2_12_FULL_31_6]